MMGLPIIAANYPGMLPIVEGEGVGLCVDPQSPAGIAAAVNRLAADPDSRQQMRDNGLRVSKNRYNWEIESVPLLQLYESITAR
jgi:glycosyltransferase involved in cell wall biosynthesis